MIIRDDLLSAEDAGWRLLLAALDEIPEEFWDVEGAAGDWSIKDVVAHIACWHSECVRHLESIRANRPIAWPDAAQFNVAAHAECADVSIKEAREMGRAARHRLREEMAIVAPVALNSRLVEALKVWTVEHYRAHLADIQAYAAVVRP